MGPGKFLPSQFWPNQKGRQDKKENDEFQTRPEIENAQSQTEQREVEKMTESLRIAKGFREAGECGSRKIHAGASVRRTLEWALMRFSLPRVETLMPWSPVGGWVNESRLGPCEQSMAPDSPEFGRT